MREIELYINLQHATKKQRLEFNYCGKFKVLLEKLKEELNRQHQDKLQQPAHFGFLMKTKDHEIVDLFSEN